MKPIQAVILVLFAFVLTCQAEAGQNQPIRVTKDTFGINLPGTLQHSAPEIDTQKNLKIYSFTDIPSSPKQVMSIMVVKYDPANMGSDLDKATTHFAQGILIGYSKRDSHPLSLQAAGELIQPTQMNNRTYQRAEMKLQHGVLNVYATHTHNTIYGFVFSSQNQEGVTEMRAALSSVKLFR